MSTENALQYQITCSGFFLGLLTGDPENKNPSQRVKIVIESLSQDIVYQARSQDFFFWGGGGCVVWRGRGIFFGGGRGSIHGCVS